MKNLAFLLLFLPVTLFAQKVKWENDTIYKDNTAWAVMTSTGGLKPAYSLRTLSGTEIAVAKGDESIPKVNQNDPAYLRITFLGDNKFGHMTEAIPVGKRLAKAFVESEVIKDNALNPSGEARFLALYPPRANATVILVSSTNVTAGPDYTTVDRNRYGMVQVIGGEVTQSSTKIGTCTTTSGAANGSTYTTISFYLPNGVKCAEATITGAASHTCTIVTMKDMAQHTIDISNLAAKEKEIAEWLAKNYYL